MFMAPLTLLTISFLAGLASGAVCTQRIVSRRRAESSLPNQAMPAESVPVTPVSEETVVDSSSSKTEATHELVPEASGLLSEKTELLSTLSYEIRTPITSILGYLDLLEEENWGRPNSLELISIVKRNSQHLLEIINNLRDLARIGTGKTEPEIENFSTQKFFRDLEAWTRVRDAQQKQQRMSINVSTAMPAQLRGDAKSLQHIVHQLVKACWRDRQASLLTLDAFVTSDEAGRHLLHLKMSDNGRPLTIDQLHELTQSRDLGETLDRRSNRPMMYGSLGLGLNLSKMLIESIGGRFAIAPLEDMGNIYELSVPVEVVPVVPTVCAAEKPASGSGAYAFKLDQTKPDHARLETSKHDPCKSEGSSASSSVAVSPLMSTSATSSGRLALPGCAPIRVLLVEDGLDNQRLIRHVLKKVGMEVDLAENGLVGLEKATRAWKDDLRYDVILMDMHMPVMDGYTATRKLRERGYQWPVIALTAHAMKSDRELCLNAGCDDYTTKPINRAELVNLVRSHARVAESTQTIATDLSNAVDESTIAAR